MAYKYAFGLFLLIIDLQISTSVPVPSFKIFSKIENCSLPQSIHVPNVELNKQFFADELKACSNIDPLKPMSYLCLEIDRLFSPLLCNQTIDRKQINVSVPYPDGLDVCRGFAKLENASSSQEYVLCKTGCTENNKLCNFLLWVEQINHALQDGVLLDSNVDQTSGHLQNNSNMTTVTSSESVSNRQVNSEIKSTNAVTASNNLTVLMHSVSSSTTQNSTIRANETKLAATEEHVTIAYVSLDLTASAVQTTSEKDTDSEAVKINGNPENANISKISVTDNLGSNPNGDKVETKETKSSSTSMPPNVQNDEPTNSFSPDVGEVGDISFDPSKEEDSLYYSTDPTSKTAVEAPEFTTSEQFSDKKPQVDTKSIGSDSVNAPGSLVDSNTSFGNKDSIQLMEAEDSHFFLYFLFVVGVVIGCYVLFHNKQKIIALIIEGRNERRRRPNGTTYRKLETK